MYLLYLRKQKGDTPVFPIVQAINDYQSKTLNRDSLIVSPGYLSVKDYKPFWDEMKKISGADTGKVKLFIFKGCSSIDTFNNNCDRKAYVRKILYKTHKDHSKIIFFVSLINNELLDNNLIKIEEAIKDKNFDNIVVDAVMIGSSNFSYTTYFKPVADKGESDILLFTDNNLAEFFKEKINNQDNRYSNFILSKTCTDNYIDDNQCKEYFKQVLLGLVNDSKCK